MQNYQIFWPVTGQLLLTVVLYFILARRKSAAEAEGRVNEERRGLHDDAWPVEVIQVNNCIRNQLEVPVLFYVTILTLWSLGAINLFSHIAAWLFFGSRVMHAYVHIGSNYVPIRRKIFIAGALMLILLLAQVVTHLVTT